MYSSARTTIKLILAAFCLAAITACGSKSSQPPPQAYTPPPVASPVVPPTPPAPSPEQQYSDALDTLSAAQTNRGRVVTIPNAEFAVGKNGLEPADSARLDKIAIVLRDNPQVRLIIEGFTDSRGSVKVDEKLTQARADAVKKALVEGRGITEHRLSARGRGKESPLADNGTKTGREKNRRVELVFSGLDGQFPSAEDNGWGQS